MSFRELLVHSFLHYFVWLTLLTDSKRRTQFMAKGT